MLSTKPLKQVCKFETIFEVSCMKSSFGLVSYFLPSLGEEGRRDNSVKSPMFVYLYRNKKKKNYNKPNLSFKSLVVGCSHPFCYYIHYSLLQKQSEMNEEISTSKEI